MAVTEYFVGTIEEQSDVITGCFFDRWDDARRAFVDAARRHGIACSSVSKGAAVSLDENTQLILERSA